MTDVTPVAEAPGDPQVVREETPWTPFPDQDAAIFDVHKPVNEAQLHSELEKALDVPVLLSTSQAPGDTSSTLWLVPGDLDQEQVQAVIDEHEANPEWGVPSTTRDFLALVRKVGEDDDYQLTQEEIQTAVKALILRSRGA
jgi:hypothetical protein